MTDSAQNLATARETLVLCDLDGTLVLDNSFHVFIACCWRRGSITQRLGLLRAVLPRALGPLAGGHRELKRRILQVFARQDQAWRQTVIDATLARLQVTRSEPIMRALAKWRSAGARIVLATAAPDTYAGPLAQSLGFECLATPGEVTPGWQELLAKRKATAVRALIDTMPGPRVIVMTDHEDDLPLLALADTAVVQAPAARFARIAAALAARPGNPLPPEHLDPTVAQEGGAQWLWLDDRPHGPLDRWEVRTILSKHRHALLYTGAGKWQRIGPGRSLAAAVMRRDCPLPPSSRLRLLTHVRRRLLRDWLGLFH